MFQTKVKDKSPEADLKEINILPDKEFKITVIKVLTEVRTMHEQSENFNKEKIFLKYQTEITELMNKITELKISIEGFYNKLD